MTREELLVKIKESESGEYREGGVIFWISEDQPNDIEARDESSVEQKGENALRACLLHHSAINESWFIYGITSTKDYAKQRDFLVRLSRIAGFDLGISDPVTITNSEKVDAVIPEETKARVREADKLEGKVEAYEKILMGRMVNIGSGGTMPPRSFA